MKVKNRLLDTDRIIFQNDEWFKFSLDSVLLADFVTLNLRIKKVMDFATGNAPIPILMSFRTSASIYGIEYQEGVYELGRESVVQNGLEDQIHLIHGDVRMVSDYFSSDSFDVVTCNPPYFKIHNDQYFNENEVKAKARHEISLNLEDVLKSASYLLKNGGIFAMVHRTERFIEIIEKMREYQIEPKIVRFIYPKKGKVSDLFLIEGTKNGNSGLKLLSPLIIHEDDDSYTKEVQEILKFEF